MARAWLHDPLEARDERTLSRLHRRYQKVPLLIVDELGFVPFKREGGGDEYRFVRKRAGRRQRRSSCGGLSLRIFASRSSATTRQR